MPSDREIIEQQLGMGPPDDVPDVYGLRVFQKACEAYDKKGVDLIVLWQFGVVNDEGEIEMSKFGDALCEHDLVGKYLANDLSYESDSEILERRHDTLATL